jgi:hypothetical protein
MWIDATKLLLRIRRQMAIAYLDYESAGAHRKYFPSAPDPESVQFNSKLVSRSHAQFRSQTGI